MSGKNLIKLSKRHTADEVSGPRLSIEKRNIILSFGEGGGFVDGGDSKFENRTFSLINIWKYRSC